MFVVEALNEFIIQQRVAGNSTKTILNYEQYIRYFLDFIGYEKQTEEIDISLLNQYVIFLQSRQSKAINFNKQCITDNKVSSITVQTYIRHLITFLNFCNRKGYINFDIKNNFKLPKAQKKIFNILTEEEIKILIKSFDLSKRLEFRNALIIVLLVDCGLRISEVLNIELDNINIDKAILKVLGKGNKERIVPLGNLSKEFIIKYIRYYRVIPKDENLKKYLFLTRTCKRIKYNTIKCLFRKLKKKTKINRLHPHLLRHTFATYYLINGGDILSLKNILGHTSLKMVEVYVECSISFLIYQYKKYSPLTNIDIFDKGDMIDGNIKKNY